MMAIIMVVVMVDHDIELHTDGVFFLYIGMIGSRQYAVS